ncbi:hypothetical protein FOZ60_004354 [Perkinsus olseni]|uniref:Fe2OG dioxygenase domain-containing protein n=1 Tax=Perkinsus olseni TaxID=32597 RepID=A0A7J6NT10_PEROL|nr:hypothetical protein FOZ60_004354 [Perkinsus olseni]
MCPSYTHASQGDLATSPQKSRIESIVERMPASLRGAEPATDHVTGQQVRLKSIVTDSRLLWSAAHVTGDLSRVEELSSCCSSSSSSSGDSESGSCSDQSDSPSVKASSEAAEVSTSGFSGKERSPSICPAKRSSSRRLHVKDGLPPFALKGYRLRLSHKGLGEFVDNFGMARFDSTSTIFRSPKSYRDFIVLPEFLSASEIATVCAVAADPTVQQIEDRCNSPSLYRKISAASKYASDKLWGILDEYEHSYPEMEYIVYDTSKGDGMIEKHVDNYSLVTLVCLLSTPGLDFTGGVNCFKCSREEGYKVPLQRGDMVLFRGEKLQHWITPVTSGRRCILQNELSRI